MYYSTTVIETAKQLRAKGYSFAQIAEKLGTAKSTASVWTTNVRLNSQAKKRLLQRSIDGRSNMIAFFKKRKSLEAELNEKLARELLNTLELTPNLSKLLCSLLYWCEGSKRDLVIFTSSDPNLMATFLMHFRNGFEIQEAKFRALMHLHEYHDEKRQMLYWGKITKIPSNQFHRTYWKPHTGKNNRLNYPGCLAVTYLDSKVAKQIRAIYNTFSNLN